jgi:hypothetical protein
MRTLEVPACISLYLWHNYLHIYSTITKFGHKIDTFTKRLVRSKSQEQSVSITAPDEFDMFKQLSSKVNNISEQIRVHHVIL